MPVRIVTISTATGTFPSTNGVDFGDQFRFASYSDNSTAVDKEVKGTVEGTVGHSPKWTTVLTLTTNSSGTRFSSTGADLVAFDKLRVVLTANNSTQTVLAWLGASD
jgi:hypothetical protein